MDKVWRTFLGRNPGVRKGIRSGGHGESSDPRIGEGRGGRRGVKKGEEGVKTEELSPLLTPKTLRPRPGLMTGIRAGGVFSPLINRMAALAIKKEVAMSRMRDQCLSNI